MKKTILCIFALICVAATYDNQNKTNGKSCHLNAHPSVEYRCRVGESFEPCGEWVRAGTVASATCRPNYYSASALPLMTCFGDVWDYVAICTPDCGTVIQQEKLKRSVGTASRGEVPWHVGVYSKTRKPTTQICGGTLVSANAVISAAHCFWDGNNMSVRPAAEYAVAAGKVDRRWDHQEEPAQTSDVRDISTPYRFRGAQTNYQDDIAVVTLATPMKFNPYVRPVCLDFDILFERKQLSPGNLGKIANWRPVPAEKSPSTLFVLDLPYVEIDRCFNETPVHFRELITSDKICAYSNDPSSKVCKGAGGGGLVFPTADGGVTRYFLRGVMSVAAREVDDDFCSQYLAFTQIMKHEHFINEKIQM